MAKATTKKTTRRDDAPSEEELRAWTTVGRGPAALAKSLGATLVPLEPDVAKEFPTSEEVNEALRLVKQIRDTAKPAKRRKSA